MINSGLKRAEVSIGVLGIDLHCGVGATILTVKVS